MELAVVDLGILEAVPDILVGCFKTLIKIMGR